MAGVTNEIDRTTELPLLRIRTAETRLLDLDVRRKLRDDDSITAVVEVTATALGRIVAADPLAVSSPSQADGVMQIQVSGGTAGETYQITVAYTTSDGESLRDVVALAVVD